MRRLFAYAFVLPVAVALAGGNTLAGGAECAKTAAAANVAKHDHEKCTMTKEECHQLMADAKTRGWLGLELDKSDASTITVTKVVAGSPAAKAGFREGDQLLAYNGVTFSEENHDKIKKIWQAQKPGATVTYNVRRNGNEQNLTAQLGTMPSEIYTAMVDEHMKEHAEVASR